MISKILKIWILVVFVVTGVLGTVYLAVQQNYRQNANDPQVQMAEDLARMSLEDAEKNVQKDNFVDTFAGKGSLAPVIVIFDNVGKVLAANTSWGERTPVLPNGVFDYAIIHGEDRITWEPGDGTRLATVVTYVTYSDGSVPNNTKSFYVLVGRDLREVEKRIDMLGLQVGAGWLATVFGSLVLIGVLEFIFPSKKK